MKRKLNMIGFSRKTNYHFAHFPPWLRLTKTLSLIQEFGCMNKRTLDVGCGDGTFLSRLKSGNLLGLDVNKEVLSLAKRRTPIALLIRGDAQSLPVVEGCFDLVVCLEVLEHLSHPEITIRELARVVNGYLIISIPVVDWLRTLSVKRGKKVEYLSQEHLREYSFVPLQRFELISSLLSTLAKEFTVVRTVGIYFFTVLLRKRLDALFLRRSPMIGVAYSLDKILGVLPIVKYFSRYLIIVCKRKSA